MNKKMVVFLFITLSGVTFLFSGCGCLSSDAKATGIYKIGSDDEYVYYEYHAYDSWYNRDKCEPCRIATLEFWLEWETWQYPHQGATTRPEAPHYEIMSKELTEANGFIYKVRVKISDIKKSLEKAR